MILQNKTDAQHNRLNRGQLTHKHNFSLKYLKVLDRRYCMSKMSRPILYSKLQYKMGHDSLFDDDDAE